MAAGAAAHLGHGGSNPPRRTYSPKLGSTSSRLINRRDRQPFLTPHVPPAQNVIDDKLPPPDRTDTEHVLKGRGPGSAPGEVLSKTGRGANTRGVFLGPL